MKTTKRTLGGLRMGAIAFLVMALPLAAQQSPAHAHMGHVADGFGNTPDGQGLLPTAVAEAEVARQHAEYAAGSLEDLAGMQRHAGHVLHAVDPTQIEGGPGAGYGVIRAAQGVVRHIGLAAADESASDNIQTHSVHVATAAGNVVTWAEEVSSLAQEIREATGVSEAAPRVREMAALTTRILEGYDANEDGRIGWQEGEGGLAQAQQHMALMKRGEEGGR